MDTAHSSAMNSIQQAGHTPAEQLGQLFGGYRAEWLREHLYDLFTEPSYFPELKGIRPCVLEGGRGTGKTTVLRCLSYEGQYALTGYRPADIPSWPFYGFYLRINTNRVTAFQGPELDERQWTRLFAHYINLELVESVLTFLGWYNTHVPDAAPPSDSACRMIAAALNIRGADTLRELVEALFEAKQAFEAYVNNVADSRAAPLLSMQGAPIDALLRIVAELPQFAAKQFFFLVDEYENLLDYQQRIVNTLVKHSGSIYTFKIGVRELGLRTRATLNENEHLISPADYARINISEKLGDRFPEFAASVCNERLHHIRVDGEDPDVGVETLFGSLSNEEEAVLLGVREHIAEARHTLMQRVSSSELEAFDQMSPLFAYLLVFWAESKGTELAVELRDFIADTGSWERRFSNYSHALLFTIRRGKRGIRKHYAGWDVLTRLAGQNIRYLLELVDRCLLIHLQQGGSLRTPVPFKVQTEAAQAIGKKNLTELEGVSVDGVRLTRLLLGLGRVFQVLAAEPEGHTPEANQFVLREGWEDQVGPRANERNVEDLLKSAVMHLALIRFPGSKLQDAGDTKAYDYMVHPIYSAFFEFSYRRKRKIVLTPSDLIGLVEFPRRAITGILTQQRRNVEEPLPDQLRLFEGFYAGGV